MLVTHNIQNKFGKQLTRHALSTVHAGGVQTLLIGLQHITRFHSKPMDTFCGSGSIKKCNYSVVNKDILKIPKL